MTEIRIPRAATLIMRFRLRPVEILTRYERRTVQGRLEPIDHCHANGRNRRVSPVSARPGEGPLTEPIAGGSGKGRLTDPKPTARRKPGPAPSYDRRQGLRP